ncbi:MAG TPA: C1 family peptidase [Bryobacteraceae bacterium]|nr:C1 family peptidase [Bryobacteraceae bacterium]
MTTKKKNTSGKGKSKGGKAALALPKFVRNVSPDSVDLRDRPYVPSITIIPAEVFTPKVNIPVLNQCETNACTGFALASVIYHLQLAAKRKPARYEVSPFMLYSMARRYDEFPGAPSADTGSSLRGAMKGWYKHGACAAGLWKSLDMPKPVDQTTDASADWWLDAVRRPLGAYYRVDTRSVTDMQLAINEIGVLYASAVAHRGWDKGIDANAEKSIWTIPQQKSLPSDGAHAFAIVGYTREGFIVHNSWHTNWGSDGRAILTYDDWTENAMDCWVAQIGVVTDLHLEIASSKSLRLNKAGAVRLASDSTLRNREISPFIIDMANNGLLSNTGDFRTQDSDVDALVNQQVDIARSKWKLKRGDVMDVAIYAHGGLVAEDAAAETAAKWIPALYDAKIFPIFFMWETGLWDTLKDRTTDLLSKQARPTGGFLDGVHDWWNARLEKLLTIPGTMIWDEMKKNADCLSSDPDSGGKKLYEACKNSPYFGDMSKVRLHLIGHSAGAIVHSLIVDSLAGWQFESANFLAPAVRADSFEKEVLRAIQSGRVKAYNQFSLIDNFEQKDHTCEPILGYGRSLLYLVSPSFEHGETTPILGMQKYFNDRVAPLNLPNVTLITAPGAFSQSTTHGGFDDDAATMKKVISLIKATSGDEQ